MLKTMFSENTKIGWFLLAAIVLLIDQVTKQLASGALSYAQPHSFLPFFNFTLLHNYGAAFSFLSDAGGWQRWLFGLIAFSVSAFLIIWIIRLDNQKKWELAGFSFVLGGAIGNLWDRVFLGYVVDFIDWFYVGTKGCLPFFYARSESLTCHWPAFNIADASIFLGAAILIVDTLFISKPEGAQ